MAAAVNYGISTRDWWNLRVPLTQLRLYPFPERVFWNYAINTNKVQTFDRLADSTGTLRLVERANTEGASRRSRSE